MRVIGGQRNYRISEDQEIRTAARAVDRIRGARVAAIKVRSRGRSQVTAGRESHNSDAIRLYTVLSRMRPHNANRSLRIAQFDGMVITRPQAILEHERRDSERVQPIR